MSRYYDVEIEVITAKPKEVEAILRENSWVDDNTMPAIYYADEKKFTASGTTFLAAGLMDEEAHEEIVELVKSVDSDAKVGTKWHCAEGWEWDNIFGHGDDDDDEES